MIEMVRRQIYPAVARYAGEIAGVVNAMRTAGAPSASAVACSMRSPLTTRLTASLTRCATPMRAANRLNSRARMPADAHDAARLYGACAACDAAETVMDGERWPIPTYTDLLLRV